MVGGRLWPASGGQRRKHDVLLTVRRESLLLERSSLFSVPGRILSMHLRQTLRTVFVVECPWQAQCIWGILTASMQQFARPFQPDFMKLLVMYFRSCFSKLYQKMPGNEREQAKTAAKAAAAAAAAAAAEAERSKTDLFFSSSAELSSPTHGYDTSDDSDNTQGIQTSYTGRGEGSAYRPKSFWAKIASSYIGCAVVGGPCEGEIIASMERKKTGERGEGDGIPRIQRENGGGSPTGVVSSSGTSAESEGDNVVSDLRFTAALNDNGPSGEAAGASKPTPDLLPYQPQAQWYPPQEQGVVATLPPSLPIPAVQDEQQQFQPFQSYTPLSADVARAAEKSAMIGSTGNYSGDVEELEAVGVRYRGPESLAPSALRMGLVEDGTSVVLDESDCLLLEEALMEDALMVLSDEEGGTGVDAGGVHLSDGT